MLTRDVVEATLEVFTDEVVALTKDGWAVVKDSAYSSPYGAMFTVSMYRDDDTVRALKEYVDGVAAAPKLTRAESLAKAREAKAAKLDVQTITA